MYIGNSDKLATALINGSNSFWLILPERKRLLAILASPDNILWVNCSRDISKLKTATGNFCSLAILEAILRQKLVLPIEGLPAIIIKSERLKPLVMASRS